MSHNHNTKSVRCSVRSRELHRGRRLLRQLDGDDRDRLVLRLPPVLHPRRLRPMHLRQQEEGCECGRGCVGAGIKYQAWLPDGYSQIFRLYVFGPSGFWTMAPLRYAAKFAIWQLCDR